MSEVDPLAKLRTDLTEAAKKAIVDSIWGEDQTESYWANVAAVMTRAQLDVVSAALESGRLRGVQEGRQQAAEAIKADCSHGDMHYGNFNPETCPICTHFVSAARGARVDQPAGEQNAPTEGTQP